MGMDYRSAADELSAKKNMANDQSRSELFKALMQSKAQQQLQETHGQQQSDLSAQNARQSDQLDQSKVDRDFSTLGRLKDAGYGNRSMKAGELSVQEPDPYRAQAARDKRQNTNDAMVEKLSKREEKGATALNSAKQLDELTDDGHGGILTNPNAKFKSMGPIASGIHSPMLIGFAEKFGLLPKGSQEERAAFQAYLNDYAHKKYGARVTPEQMERESVAHGFVSGGDPGLTAKAVRQRTGDLVTEHNAVVGGYNPDVQAEYNSRFQSPLAGTPVYNDPAKNAALARQGGGQPQQAPTGLAKFLGPGKSQPVVQPSATPQGSVNAAPQASKRIRQKSTGKMFDVSPDGSMTEVAE